MLDIFLTKGHIWFPGIIIASVLITRISVMNYALRKSFRKIRFIKQFRYYVIAWVFFLFGGIKSALSVMIFVTVLIFLTSLVNATLRKHTYLNTLARSFILFLSWTAIY